MCVWVDVEFSVGFNGHKLLIEKSPNEQKIKSNEFSIQINLEQSMKGFI